MINESDLKIKLLKRSIGIKIDGEIKCGKPNNKFEEDVKVFQDKFH